MQERIDNIGIDGDGILTNLDVWQYALGLEKLTGIKLLDLAYMQEFSCLEELIEYYKTAYLKKNGINVDLNEIIKNPNAYHIKSIFGISKMKEYAIATFAFVKYCQKYQFRQKAGEITNKWSNERRKIHIITARKFCSKDSFVLFKGIVRSGFMKLMEQSSIPYDSVTWCSENGAPIVKRKACEKLGIDFMLEDRPDIVKEVSKVTKVGCFDATYNKESVGTNIYRIYNDFVGADEQIKVFEKVR